MLRTLKNLAHLVFALVANIFYAFPSKDMVVIAVTGTDGKTTTSSIIYHILISAKLPAALISTINAKIDGETIDTGFHTTTPSAFALQKIIAQAKNRGIKYLVLETTSHALDQNRIWGVNPEIAVYTNITPEHLDYHKTFENYLYAKSRLGSMSKKIVLNQDDPASKTLNKIFTNKKLYYYGKKSSYFNFAWIKSNLNIPLAEFNQYNYLASALASSQLGIDEKIILKALQSFCLPMGRMSVLQKEPYQIMVDFAHTPNALDAILKYCKNNCSGKLIHVYGSAGLRDQQKRFAMGLVSTKYSDLIILTEEDYRTEDLNKIFEQISLGTREGGFHYVKDIEVANSSEKLYTTISRRDKAITKALELAQKNDTVLITGKGHEQSLARGTVEHPWNDIEFVKTILK